jgi:hypothetical protein
MVGKIPELRTDKELAAFLEQDLTDYITPDNFKPARFEFLPKATAAHRSKRRPRSRARSGSKSDSPKGPA